MKFAPLYGAFLLLAACATNTPKTGDAGAPRGQEGGIQAVKLTRQQLMDPETCKGCHPVHYREWASSMHAYAADDPVFLAMNQRGQRETNGELGDFCVRCHAPMAVNEGATTDGLNIDQVPKHLKGVTCYFCHNAVGVEGDHNGEVALANDAKMRANISDPIDAVAHEADYDPHMDRYQPEASKLCGACHDVVTPNGVHLERTSKEYHESGFAQPGPGFQSCPICHMRQRPGTAATIEGIEMPERTVHEHLWPAVDVAVSPFPDRDTYKTAVECALSLGVKVAEFSVAPNGTVVATIEAEVGHSMPSGSAQDRRLWAELVAYDADDNVVFQTGVVGDREPVVKGTDDADFDPYLQLFRDRIFDADGEEVHMFWEAEKSAAHPEGYESSLIPTAASLGRPHSVFLVFETGRPDLARITFRMRMRPMGLEILQDLVDSGDLSASVLDEMPTYTVYGTEFEWNSGDDPTARIYPQPPPLSCPNDYRCVFDPTARGCP